MLRPLRTPSRFCLAVVAWVCVQDVSPVLGQPGVVTPVTDATTESARTTSPTT